MWHSIGIQCRGKWKYNFFWKYLEFILFIFFYCFLQLLILLTYMCVFVFFLTRLCTMYLPYVFLPFSKRICTHHFRNQSWAIVFCIAPQTNTQQICLALQSLYHGTKTTTTPIGSVCASMDEKLVRRRGGALQIRLYFFFYIFSCL